jgi:hypothetical protein
MNLILELSVFINRDMKIYNNYFKSIQALQKERNSTIICYIIGDRSFGIGIPSLATQIGSDVVRYSRDILQEIGTRKNSFVPL